MASRRAAGSVLAFGLAACSAPTLAELPHPAPAAGRQPGVEAEFERYTGDESVAGDWYVDVQRYRRASNGQLVTLAPMVHVADAGFYARIGAIVRASDVVLTEGVGGPPSFAPTSFLMTWVFENYDRVARLGGLAPQASAFDPGPRAEPADLARAELESQSSVGTSLLHCVAFPALVLLVEPLHFGRWCASEWSHATGEAVSDEAAFRHWFVRSLAPSGAEASAEPGAAGRDVAGLFPDLIESRNAALLAKLDAALLRPGVQSVAIPWGARHMPGLAAALRRRGFAPLDHEWVRAIAVKALLEGDAGGDGEVASHTLYLPWLVDWRRDSATWSFGAVLDAVAFGRPKRDTAATSLLWGYLLRLDLGPPEGESSFTLLPCLSERPLLLDWRRRGDHSRWRFLWFFEVGE